jgi:hypothetical protein
MTARLPSAASFVTCVGPRHTDAANKQWGPTSAVVQSNRQLGPEIVMCIVDERTPAGFERLEDVISQQELEEIAQRYKVIAGFDKERLKAFGRS